MSDRLTLTLGDGTVAGELELSPDFQARFGNPSDAQGGVDYLTRRVLADAGEAAGLRWRYLLPRHGWRWTLRRAWRRLRLGRESAAFPVALGERR